MINYATWTIVFITVVASSIWVAVDAHRQKVSTSDRPYSVNSGALAWLSGCLLLWVVVFPAYLFKRAAVIKSRGREPSKAALVVGPLAIALVMVCVLWPLIGERLQGVPFEPAQGGGEKPLAGRGAVNGAQAGTAPSGDARTGGKSGVGESGQSETKESPVSLVKGSTLSIDNSTTLGNAFDNYGFFKSRTWSEGQDPQKRRIVTFRGEYDLDKFLGAKIGSGMKVLGEEVNLDVGEENIAEAKRAGLKCTFVTQFRVAVDSSSFAIKYCAIHFSTKIVGGEWDLVDDNNTEVGVIYENKPSADVGKVVIGAAELNKPGVEEALRELQQKERNGSKGVKAADADQP